MEEASEDGAGVSHSVGVTAGGQVALPARLVLFPPQ